MKEERERCLDAGMDALLTKPVEPDKLQRLLDGLPPDPFLDWADRPQSLSRSIPR